MRVAFGPHLAGELSGCDVALMRDGEFVYRFMLGLCENIGLIPMGSPHIDFYTGPHKEWEGASATLHVQTSHITAHFFAFGFVFIDIFSCKPFNRDAAEDFISNALHAEYSQWEMVRRGTAFPDYLKDLEQLTSAPISTYPEVRVFGLALEDLRDMRDFAETNGWRARCRDEFHMAPGAAWTPCGACGKARRRT